MDGISLQGAGGIHAISLAAGAATPASELRANPSQVAAHVTRSPIKPRLFSFKYPDYFWPRKNNHRSDNKGMAIDDAVLAKEDLVEEESDGEGWNGENLILETLHLKSFWNNESGKDERSSLEAVVNDEKMEKGSLVNNEKADEVEEECDGCRVEDDDIEFDKYSFTRLLSRVSLSDAKLYAQMSYLGMLAYRVPKIKVENLLHNRGLNFVTSSLEKRIARVEKDQASEGTVETEEKRKEEVAGDEQKSGVSPKSAASVAYDVTASAASYLHYHAKSLLPFSSSKESADEVSTEGGIENAGVVRSAESDMASFMATTDSVTAVVAAKEEVKQAVADDLSSVDSSPCEWFICDDEERRTRYFVIQGSESLASWQANLLFEPVSFEGLGVLVHRGIYEAAKGIYEQMLPEIHSHLKSQGGRGTLRFTGHSLGGSLAMLINLMLLIRGEAPISSLLPVITYGSPCIMCGGNKLLSELSLPKNHVQAITMHRDIVPRAFSTNLPPRVVDLLKAINGNMRNHPCLNKQKVLYEPMGEFFILQPDEKFSPPHYLLPNGPGLYLLTCPSTESTNKHKILRAALSMFLNSPHPLEILSDRAAYGSEGTIIRDHDMYSYLKSLRTVIRYKLNQIRKTRREREHHHRTWWPLVSPRGIPASMVSAPLTAVSNIGQQYQFKFSGILQTGQDSMKRFGRLVASQHMHLLMLFLLPAKMLVLGTFDLVSFR